MASLSSAVTRPNNFYWVTKVIYKRQEIILMGRVQICLSKEEVLPSLVPYTRPFPDSFLLKCSWADCHRLCWNLEGKPRLSTQPDRTVVLKVWCWTISITQKPIKNAYSQAISLTPNQNFQGGLRSACFKKPSRQFNLRATNPEDPLLLFHSNQVFSSNPRDYLESNSQLG